jgi:tetratricopeptide (TPR) repeat protein
VLNLEKRKSSGTSRPIRPARAAGLVAAMAWCLVVSCQPPAPPPPVIPTADLDPAVARLVETTLLEVRAAPDSATAWGKLGSVLMHYEFIQPASDAFAEAERLAPSDPRWPYLHGVLLRSADPGVALSKLRRAVSLSPERLDAPRLTLAQFLAERGQAAEAETLFNVLLRGNSAHTAALLGLARLYQGEGRWVDCTNLLVRCLSDPRTTKSAHVLLAAVQQVQGDATSAALTARRSSELSADAPWPDAWWTEALAYRVGRKARLEDASELIEQRQPMEAARILRGVTQDYPSDDEAWYQLGWALNQVRQFAEAEPALRQHLRLSPDSPKGHAQLAVALLGGKRYDEAIAVLEAGLRLKPGWRELHSNLGYACVQLGRHAEAIAHYRDALSRDPNYVPSYTALAELLRLRGEHDEARRLARQALDLEPSNAFAKSLLQRLEPTTPGKSDGP